MGSGQGLGSLRGSRTHLQAGHLAGTPKSGTEGVWDPERLIPKNCGSLFTVECALEECHASSGAGQRGHCFPQFE